MTWYMFKCCLLAYKQRFGVLMRMQLRTGRSSQTMQTFLSTDQKCKNTDFFFIKIDILLVFWDIERDI